MPRPKIDVVIGEIKLPSVNEELTIANAQKLIRNSLEEGGKDICRCCGRAVTRYQKKLSPILAARLLTFASDYLNNGGADPVPFSKKPSGKTVNFADLENWGFIEIVKDKGEDGKMVKLAKLTKEGLDFSIGNEDAPLHMFFYNNEIIGEGTEEVDIEEALGNEYDYEKLIKNCDKLKAETKV